MSRAWKIVDEYLRGEVSSLLAAERLLVSLGPVVRAAARVKRAHGVFLAVCNDVARKDVK